MGYEVKHYQRPNREIIDKVAFIAESLTVEWFTPDVIEALRKDLLFHDVLCAEIGGEIISFLIFTSWEGAIHITLMGTKPDFRGKGLGSVLMEYLFEYARSLEFNRVTLLTVPPEFKVSYHPTVEFYKKHGFTIEKMYSELWESGAIKMTKVPV